jgi:hypothetical protein
MSVTPVQCTADLACEAVVIVPVVEGFPASNAERLAWRSVAAAMGALQAAEVSHDKYRLIGGAMVTLHVRRLGLDDVAIRAKRDADIGLPLTVLTESPIEAHLSAIFENRRSGNRWTSNEGLTVDVLVHEARASMRLPMVNGRQFDRAAGLHLAMRRPAVMVDVLLEREQTRVPLPDALGAVALKVAVFQERHETKDLDDLWRLLEVALAEGVEAAELQAVLGPVDKPRSYLAELRRIAAGGRMLDGLDKTTAVKLRALAAAYVAEI